MAAKKKYKYKVRRAFTYKGVTKDIRAKNETEYEAKKEKFKAKIDSMALSGQNLTVTEWAEKCIRDFKPNQKEITKRKYTSRMRHCILEEIGNVPIAMVNTDMCQAVLDKQSQNSQAQINEVYNALRFIFKRAVISKHVLEDPTIYLEKPKGSFNPRRALTTAERRSVLGVASTKRRYYFALLMMLCGCRSSEAIECKGKDIIGVRTPVLRHVKTNPLKTTRIYHERIAFRISASSSGSGILSSKPFDKVIEMHSMYNALNINGTKTEKSKRIVPIPDELYELIKNTPDESYIAQDSNGNQMTETSRRNAWRALKKEILTLKGQRGQLGDDLCPYCLRHEYCTDLARKGVDLRTAQYLMGHSTISLTANIYSNLTSADLAQISSLLGFSTQKAKQI